MSALGLRVSHNNGFDCGLKYEPREDLEDIHNKTIENVTMLGPEGIQAVKNNEFDVVVRLLDDEVDEAGRRSWKRRLERQRCINGNKATNTPFTAAEFCVNVVNVVAASYFTACDDAFNSSKMQRI